MSIQTSIFDFLSEQVFEHEVIVEEHPISLHDFAYSLYLKELSKKHSCIIQYRDDVIYTIKDYLQYRSSQISFFNFGDKVEVNYERHSSSFSDKKYHGKRGLVYWHSSLVDYVYIVLEDFKVINVLSPNLKRFS